MGWLATLSLALGASWVSGIRLYAAVAMLGLLGRYAHLALPGELEVVTNGWVIGVASGLYAIEFIADKVPYVDSAWDAVHTFIRIPAGAVLAALAFGDFDKSVQVIAFLLGGGIALTAHSTKALTRATVNTSPEPFSNIAVSLGEDVVSLSSVALAVYQPLLAVVLIGIALMVSFFLIPHALRTARRLKTALRKKGGATSTTPD